MVFRHIVGVAPLWATIDNMVALAIAFALGTAIGFERQWRQRNAGLRTNVLVAVGAAAFAELGIRLAGDDGAARIIGQIVSGMGFLGAGVILKDGTNIRGLNTAATLWCSAAVGTFAGAGLLLDATIITLFVLAGNTLLRPLVNWINRHPLAEGATEARYSVHASCLRQHVSAARALLNQTLSQAHYPIRHIELQSHGPDHAELTAELVPTSADPAELDHIIGHLQQSPHILSATWVAGTVA